MLAVILLTLITVVSGENELNQQQWVTKILYDTLEDYVPNGESTCKRDGLVYRDGLKDLKLWATQMYDASAKFPTGILSGKSFDFGDYDECLETNTTGLDFKPQYCIVNVRFKPSVKLYPNYYAPILPELSSSVPIWEAIKPNPNPIKIQRNEISVSVCIPSSCTHSDLQSTLSPKIVSAFNEHKINTTVSVDPLYCTTQLEESPITLGFIIFWCFISIIIMLIIVGSLYDVFSKKDAEKIKPKNIIPTCLGPIIVAFSVQSNLKRLFYNNAKTAEFSGINFLKVLSCVAVIFGHRSMYISSQPLYNTNKFEETFEVLIYGIIHNGPLVVDIFFVISGFLMYLGVYSQLVKSKRLNMPFILFWRWYRLIPLYGLMIAVHSFVLLHLANGPLWKHVIVQESENCRENWWTNILFINNYVNADRPCMIQSWYLACDLHLFILGLLIAYFVWKYPKCEKFVLLTAIVVSCLIPAYVVYKHKFYPTFFGFISNTRNPPSKTDFTLLYVPTHTRAAPYFVGMFAAYIYRRTKAYKPDFRFTYPTMRLCAVFFIALLWMMTIFYFFVTEYNVWMSVAYALAFRLIFATFVAAFILISTINTCFRGTWSLVLAPLSRLTYGAYLGGLSVQLYHVAVARTPTYFNPVLLLWTAIGDWTIGFIVAFFLYLLIECPFENLLRHLVDKIKRGKHETEVVQTPKDVEMSPKNTEGNIT